MVMDEPNGNVNNIMSGIENTGGVLHNRKKLKQRFDIIKKLGQGTYGKVQLGINKETGQEVAIKTIKKCKIESSADLVRIRREVQIMSSVRHPNIIHIYEVFENREKMVLVMEYAAGGELYDYLSSRKVLPEEEARRIFRQISTAIYYCHKHKICHRDLKLENILLDEHGSAKIADFGLSNVFAESRTLSTYCGSPLYASPEIVTGTPYNGPEVDCWSLGVLLYTMVYGAMPFDGTHFKTLVRQISLGDYFEPKKKSPASSLIKDMLTVSSKDRADVERICSHWWVNEGYEHSCLDIAEELASQTPVRLDLLLSLNPQTVDSEKLVVTEEQVAAKEANEAMDAAGPVLTRSQSADSVMDTEMTCPDAEAAAYFHGDHAIKPSSTKIITPAVDIVEESKADSTKRKLDEMESSEKVNQPPKARPVVTKTEESSNEPAPAETGAKPKKEDKPITEKRKTVKRKVAPQTETPKANDVKEEPVTENAKPQAATPQNNVECAKPETKEETASKIKPRIVKKKIVPKPEETTESTENDANVENTSNNIQKPKERRKSRILEAAEKFNSPNNAAQTGTTKKIFIPENDNTVNTTTEVQDESRCPNDESVIEPPAPKSPVSDGKALALSLSLEDARRSLEHSISLINEEKNISDKELHKKMTANNEKSKEALTKEQQMKQAVETISNAIPRLCIGGRKPPVPYGAFGRSSSMGPSIGTLEKLKMQSSMDKFNYSEDQPNEEQLPESQLPSPTSATLPRRKVSTAEIKLRKPDLKADAGRLSFNKTPMTFRTEVEHKVGDLRSAPVRPAADNRMWGGVSQMRAASLEPEKRAAKERFVPIQIKGAAPTTPLYQRTASVKSNSLSRQSTADSDGGESTMSTMTNATGAEPIRKSPREVIIPIAVEGGGYVTPRATSLEPSEVSSRTSTTGRSGRTRRMNSLLSDNSGDESTGTFGRLHRHSSIGRDSDGEDGRFHLHRLRSSRPSRGMLEPSDSVSSGEDDDDDGFEILTAENLFSTLLSRVRSLTQRLNVDEDGRPTFPRSSLLGGPFGSHKPFWERDPLSRRLNSGLGTAAWRRSTSRDSDSFGSPDWSSNNTLPRGRKSKKKYDQDSSKIPTVNNNDCTTNDPSGLELDLADLDLSRLKLSQSELDALTNLTPSLSQKQQNQLLSQLPPTQARKLSRHLSLRLPKQNSQKTIDSDVQSISSSKTYDKIDSSSRQESTEIESEIKSRSLRNSFRSVSEYSNDSSYSIQNSTRTTPDRSVLSKYLPLQKGASLTDSTADSAKVRKQPSQRRISRFLRPDFFDTPRDESSYAKQKREQELETQKVLREIRVKRDRSVDRSYLEKKEQSYSSKEVVSKSVQQSPPPEPVPSSEKDNVVAEIEKTDTLRQRKSSIGSSKIARPKSLVINSEKTESLQPAVNTENGVSEKAPVKSKLPTSQNRKESKLLRPKSYPSSAFSAGNDIDIAIKTEVEKKDSAQPANPPIISSEKALEPEVKDVENSEQRSQVKNIEKKEDATKKSQDAPSGFLQTIGQTLDKLTKTKTTKKSSKEQTGASGTKSSSKQSALKLLKRKTTVTSEKKTSQQSEVTNTTLKTENVISDSVPPADNVGNVIDSNKTQAINNNAPDVENKPSDISNETPPDDQNINSNKSSTTESKSERKSRIENVIRSLRERSIPRGPMAYTESGLIKRAVSVEDVTGHLKPSRRSVSKVLDLFNKIENTDNVRKKEDANSNVKSKSKIKTKETPERPKSLIINYDANEKTGLFKDSADNINHNNSNGQVINASINEPTEVDNAKPNNFTNSRKSGNLKLDFSKVNNYRKSMEKAHNENSVTKAIDVPQKMVDSMNNHTKDLDPSDISSATTCLSPNFEPELAFDDWSVCSDSVINKNNPLSSTYSDVSPNFDTHSEMEHHLNNSHIGSRSYSNHSALDNSDCESIVDRIKRKSYYLRFNEKKQKRKSSLVGPGAKDYYSSPVFDGKLDRLGSKPTSPLQSPDTPSTSSFSKYRHKKSIDLAKPISLDYSSSTNIKRRESCSAFDRRLSSSTIHGRSYSSLENRSPQPYGRSYLSYGDSKHSTSPHLNGTYGDYSSSIQSSKDILYNRDYSSKDYTDPTKSPYSRRSYIGSYNGNYHTYNPSLPYSFDTSSRSESHSTNSIPDHSANTDKPCASSPSPSLKEDQISKDCVN